MPDIITIQMLKQRREQPYITKINLKTGEEKIVYLEKHFEKFIGDDDIIYPPDYPKKVFGVW